MSKFQKEILVGLVRGILLGALIHFAGWVFTIVLAVALLLLREYNTYEIKKLVKKLHALYPTESDISIVGRNIDDMHTLGMSKHENVELVRTFILIPKIRRKFIDTYFHERRHDQQRRHMRYAFSNSLKELESKNMFCGMFGNREEEQFQNYFNSWHETDARKCAAIMTKWYLRNHR